MEFYIYDMLAKSIQVDDYLDHLLEAFIILWKYNLKLNKRIVPLELA